MTPTHDLRHAACTWLCAAALVGAAACDATDAPMEPEDAPDLSADDPASDPPAPAPLELAPAYVFDLVSTVVERDIDTGEESTRTTTARGLLGVTQTGAEFELSLTACDVVLPQLAGRQPEVADGLFASLPPIAIPGQLVDADDSVVLATEPAAILLGAELDDPVNDDLPTSGSDPAVIDADGDGEVGVTLMVTVPVLGDLEVYVAAKLVIQLTAPIDDPAAFNGSTLADLDYEIYGDNSFLIDAKGLAEEDAAKKETVSEDHVFAVSAVAPETTCETIPEPEPEPEPVDDGA